MLTDEQVERYSRHIILPQLGVRGQERLLAAAVAVVGDDMTAATANLYLAAAGIGRLTITQDDNAVHDLTALNPDCHISQMPAEMSREDAAVLVRAHDVVIDASGSHAISIVLNRACVELEKPLVWGRVNGAGGEVTVFVSRWEDGPCYACLIRSPAARSDPQLFAAAPSFVGSLQATEAIKLITGVGETLRGRMAVYDVLASGVRHIDVKRDYSCPVCHAGGVGIG